ncbi:MAG TPA: LLM class flavin-dependent oxidoreductase [Caulobacteraceae bacterium]|nr:LLM class flavin-dependent oxidoreductase [Caulobacteraceae bacterium]
MKEIILNAFETNAPGFMPPGQWANPRDHGCDYLTLEHWTGLARLLERGKFDGIFIADVMGMLDVYGGNADATIRAGAWTPCNDPMMLVPAMAMVTQHLGFGITGNLSYETPYLFARRMSTLDHLTRGRLGWNIVTGYLDSAAKACGQTGQLPHAERYQAAEEYMEIMYKLWEGSWEDGAVVRDRERRIYALPEKVHKVKHEGKHYRIEAYHRSEPSPQRTPVLYQAGSSGEGRGFAARHCECIFVAGQNKPSAAEITADIRRRAADSGRDPRDIKVIVDALTVIGATEAEAREKEEEHRRYLDPEGSLVMISAATGIDLKAHGLDNPLSFVKSEANVSTAEGLTKRSHKVWTPREIANHLHAGRGAVIVGTPEQVADEMIAWVDETGVDGFNLSRGISPGTFEDVVEMLVPELQRRGRFKRDYAEGTLRQKLHGRGGPRLPDAHPASTYRWAGPVLKNGS